MDVWTLNEKLKIQQSYINILTDRLNHIEDFLSRVTRKTKDEAVPDKKDKSSSVRAKRSTTKKSKGSK